MLRTIAEKDVPFGYKLKPLTGSADVLVFAFGASECRLAEPAKGTALTVFISVQALLLTCSE